MASTGLHWVATDLVACIEPVTLVPPALWDEELPLVAEATPRVRAKFAAGRSAARQAMAALGISPSAIGRGIQGEPLFPNGVIGSISHTPRFSVALVGKGAGYRSLGVDLDDERRLGDAAALEFSWENEVSRISRALGLGRAEAQNFAFSAKEAIFKCQYSLTLDAELKAHQARLRQARPCAQDFRVSGWRATAATAAVLAAIRVRRIPLGGLTMTVAAIALSAH